ncbi:MAG: antibiotic biosynthesis monooxygenase family protein [Anaerolineales bacterium]
MIARIWHGATQLEKAEAYTEYLYKTGIPDYKATEGNLSAYILKRREGNLMHFLALTFWESEEAIRRFAGDDLEKARYYPEDEDFLVEKEPFVNHYEVVKN